MTDIRARLPGRRVSGAGGRPEVGRGQTAGGDHGAGAGGGAAGGVGG